VEVEQAIVTVFPYCFNVPWFNRCFPHKIKLNFIHRQSDTTLIKCINALEKGNMSDEDVAFINSLSRSLENEENCVHWNFNYKIISGFIWNAITCKPFTRTLLRFFNNITGQITFKPKFFDARNLSK
jgi:hypothetical protein